MPSHSNTLASIKLKAGLPAQPLGFYVLVEVVEVENMSESGIYLGNQGREQSAEEAGYLRAVGPTAYLGWEGCDVNFELEKQPFQMWGLEIGDLIEFRAYEGKKSAIPGFERWRYIPDSHVVGVINQAKE